MMRKVRVALGLALACAIAGCGTARAQDAGAQGGTARDITATASVPSPLGDPDAEIRYARPRRVIAPPVYGYPGPPLNPGGVPYDELFASPTPFDLPDLLLPPDDPYAY